MNSAIYYASDGFKVSNQVMGRQVAGNSFLKAYAKYIQQPEFWVYSNTKKEAKEFTDFIRNEGRKEDVKFINFENTGALKKPGVLFYPGPDIAIQSKNRSFFAGDLWSICGITHTTCSYQVMESIQSLVTSPVNPWDALICTSNAVHSNVLKIIETEEDNLRFKLKASRFVRPQLPVIPLGIHSDKYTFTKEDKVKAKNEFLIKNDEIVILFVGRLSFHAKANPFAMYKSLDCVAQASNKNIVLIECGWHGNQGIKDAFIEASEFLCKNIRMIRIDGTNDDLKFKSFAAADIFCSLSDNIQETFGITPIEAMAAGLPVISSDWDGYRDTVRNGQDGFLIPTLMPPPGYGLDLAARYAFGIDNYDMYIGNISNFVSVDFRSLTHAFDQLINNDQLRIDMAKSAIKRVSCEYDWSKVMMQYQDLWKNLDSIRTNSSSYNYKWSARLDPFFAFESYPTTTISNQSKIILVENSLEMTFLKLKKISSLFIVNYSKYTMPDKDFSIQLLTKINEKSTTIVLLKEYFAEANETYLTRSLLWLSKFNIIEIKESKV